MNCSTMHENDPNVRPYIPLPIRIALTTPPLQVLESEKQKNLTGQQHKTSAPHEHAPGWNEYLASASEAAVKADGSNISPDLLAKHTVERVKARHHADDAPDKMEAVYEREEVEGPIKGKGKANGN